MKYSLTKDWTYYRHNEVIRMAIWFGWDGVVLGWRRISAKRFVDFVTYFK
jgi:hypothetical protein